MGDCQYTADHNRNCFLKSLDDEWQNEFRIFWKTTNEKWVEIPAGTARKIAAFI